MFLKTFEKTINCLLGEDLDRGLVRNHIDDTLPSIMLNVKNPTKHFPSEYFSFGKYCIGRIQRGVDVTETRINDTTIQEYTCYKCIYNLNFYSGI
jgi:hypothetical protein